MGITSSFNRDIVQHRFDAFLQEVEKLQIEMMQELGEKCVTEMRLNKGYTMQTGALLSSSGYSVFKDGVAIHTAFEAASGADSTAAAQGIKKGQSLAGKVGKETKGFPLLSLPARNTPYMLNRKVTTSFLPPNTWRKWNCQECFRN